MKHRITELFVFVGLVLAIATMVIPAIHSSLKPSQLDLFKREALTRGFAYYTNAPDGKPVFTWREK